MSPFPIELGFVLQPQGNYTPVQWKALVHQALPLKDIDDNFYSSWAGQKYITQEVTSSTITPNPMFNSW